jgi:allantoin racemase
VCKSTPGAPTFIETYQDQLQAAPGMIRLIEENEAHFDAFIIACHCDPNLDAMKEATRKPVVGIGEASMKIATMLGHRFSVLSATSHSIPGKEDLINKYHIQESLASVRTPLYRRGIGREQAHLEAGRSCVEEDMAEVIVLGCADMTGLDKFLQAELGVPVLDGVVCALIIASGLARYKVSTSKILKYSPSEAKSKNGEGEK